MADWTNLPNQAVGVGGLPSGTTVTALRENPIAIAQGAAGAPRNVSASLASRLVARTTAASTVFHGVSDLDSSLVIKVFNLQSVSEVRLSNDNGANWIAGPTTSGGDITINLNTGRVIVVNQDQVISGAPFNAAQVRNPADGASVALWEYLYRGDGL